MNPRDLEDIPSRGDSQPASDARVDTDRRYEKPVLTEIPLESEQAVLGACRIVAVSCDTFHY